MDILWVGSVLNDYLNLDDREAIQLIKYRFGYKPNQHTDNCCYLCDRNAVSADHDINCPVSAGIRQNRHNYFCNKIMTAINLDRNPRIVCAALKNMQEDSKKKPDIEFNLHGILYYIDVVYAADDKLDTAFQTKITKYGITKGLD